MCLQTSFLKKQGNDAFAPMALPKSEVFVDGNANGRAEVTVSEAASLLVMTQNDRFVTAFSPNLLWPRVPVVPFDR